MPLPFRLNPSLAALPVYQPGRPIEEVARELGLDPAEILKLASNENPLGPSPRAVVAMRDALRKVHLYPDGSAFELKRHLAGRLEVDPAQLILGNGSNEIIELLGHALLSAQVEVVVSQYCFAVYPIVTRLFGAALITVPAVEYGHDLPAMLRAVTPATRLVLVANPNNPTGTLAGADEVRRMIEAVPDHVVLVMDEAYFEFLEQPTDLLPWIRSKERPNLILLRTFSKIHGLAGLRIGYGIGHPDFVSVLETIRQPFNINSMAQAAACAALDDLEHVRETRRVNTEGRRALEQGFRSLGLAFVPSAANFVLVRVGRGQSVCTELQRRGIITRPMQGYGLPEWIRVSVARPAENQRLLTALEAVLIQGA